MGVSALGVTLELTVMPSNGGQIRRCWGPFSAPVLGVWCRRTMGCLQRRLCVDDLVQNVIGVVAARTYSVVGFSRPVCVPDLRKNSGEMLWTKRYRSSTTLM